MTNSGIGCTLRFANGRKLCGMVDTLVGRDVIQRDNLQRQAYVNLLKFNKAKCKSCTWARTIPITNTGWVENGLRAVLGRKTCEFGQQEAQHEL
ncbi:hypothetical protein DUI87_10837 [Hirundo rustica rustica]|uniref:Uncharacterized protein n=1 Tax=Hirundo rustica rustica TaxID=333673 RepID=A0A3M0KJ71_HIRRU|nr:hypothetical protein DUI87_10837 [Hirundo rustica rustica]